SAGSPLEVRWKSAGSPLEVRWKSAGSPLEVRIGAVLAVFSAIFIPLVLWQSTSEKCRQRGARGAVGPITNDIKGPLL
ncbi:hypothetical protein E4U46_001013, partial [Claviceps purpurea]